MERAQGSVGARSVVVRRVVSRMETVLAADAGLVWEGEDGRAASDACGPGGLGTPEAVGRFVAGRIGDEAQEVFVAVLVDGAHRASGWVPVSRGTLTSSLVHPREVFGPALRLGAAALLVAHNHPTGRTTPSVEDVELTRRLLRAGELLGVPLLDHVIVGGPDRWRSLRREDRAGVLWPVGGGA